MNFAIIIAGGTGTRMGANIPKQFILVKNKPVLAYTIESFEKHHLVDKIIVVCVDGWQNYVLKMKKKYNFSKLSFVVTGGLTGQESIRNGVYFLENIAKPDDNIIIHDGIRPLVDPSVLEDLLSKCDKYGNAVTSMLYNEQIFIIDDDVSTTKYIPRETLRRVATPQCYKYDLLLSKYKEAFEKKIGITGSSYTNTMMVDLGVKLYLGLGSDKNIKLTSPGDLEIFEAMLEKKND